MNKCRQSKDILQLEYSNVGSSPQSGEGGITSQHLEEDVSPCHSQLRVGKGSFLGGGFGYVYFQPLHWDD